MTVHHTLESQQIYLINLVSLRLLFEKCVTGIEGMICEGNYNGSVYYFDKNTLGDIVAIRNESGSIVATYEYDAWGNVTVKGEYGIINTNSTFIGNINPFRYRGYYYDNETGFYYLQTRYYDPTICRFINADNYELVAELSSVAGQLNMYAYCNNNPIMYTDESGEIVISLLVGLGISFVVGAGISIVSQGVQKGWDNINYLQAGVDGLFAVASTAIAYTGIGIVASMTLGAGIGFAQYGLSAAAFGGEFNLQGALFATGLGGIAGALCGVGAKNVSNISKHLSGRAGSGIKALVTATQRYGIESVQVGLVRNLYQTSINTATQQIVGKTFTKAVAILNAAAAVNAIGMYFLA